MNDNTPPRVEDDPPVPMTDDEAADFHREVTSGLKRILVSALRNAYDHVTIVALDMPGVLLNTGREIRKKRRQRPAFVTLGFPDQVVKNLNGPDDQRDLLMIVHIPRSLQNKIEGSETPLIVPGGPGGKVHGPF